MLEESLECFTGVEQSAHHMTFRDFKPLRNLSVRQTFKLSELDRNTLILWELSHKCNDSGVLCQIWRPRFHFSVC